MRRARSPRGRSDNGSQPVAAWAESGMSMELLFVTRSLEIVKQMPPPDRDVTSLPLSQDLHAKRPFLNCSNKYT